MSKFIGMTIAPHPPLLVDNHCTFSPFTVTHPAWAGLVWFFKCLGTPQLNWINNRKGAVIRLF